jgi:2-dehydropantoate 2-reductase
MKIVIVGPGAIGLLFAGLLSRSRGEKTEICLLDKKRDRADRLNKSGIRLEGLTVFKTGLSGVSADPKDFEDADFWLFCVKSYDTKTAAKAIQSFVSKDATVVSLQNGLGNIELLAETFGANRVIAGVTSMGATLTEEGVCRHAGEGETLFGRLDGSLTVALKDLREIFLKAKVPAKISRDVTGLIWSKLIVNVGINALSAITRLKNGSLTSFEGSRRLMKEAVQEAFRVAKRKRIKLPFDDPLAKASSVCEATADNVSSMLADILAQKRTEIDYLNGAIVRQADSLGLKAPVNALLVDIIKTLESGYQDQVREA